MRTHQRGMLSENRLQGYIVPLQSDKSVRSSSNLER